MIRADLTLTIADGRNRADKISLSPGYGLPHSSVQRPVGSGVQSRVLVAFCDGLALNVASAGEAVARGSE